MSRLKVLSVFGTRPEATKMCPLVKELSRRPEIDSIVLSTGQHREMLDSVLRIFDVIPDKDLAIMKPGQTQPGVVSDILFGVTEYIREIKPDIVLVHGDTTTSFASALAAFYEKALVGHVEAGLRTYDKWSPYPEEMNRCLTTRIAELHFAPTANNVSNLAAEGVTKNVYITGNTGLDSFAYTIKKDYRFRDKTINEAISTGGRVIVMTAHRRENLGEGIANICSAVRRIAERYPDVTVVYPVHLNPAVRDTVFPALSGISNVRLCDPVDVTDMHNLMSRSNLCLTDSGGLQEEAPALGLPVLVLRSETERPEAAEAGTVKVIGTDPDVIFNETCRLLDDKTAYAAMANAVNPYGDGHASERIADAIINYFGC